LVSLSRTAVIINRYHLQQVPSNRRRRVILGGDGAVVVREIERAAVSNLGERSFTSKAGPNIRPKRGSELKTSPNVTFNQISIKQVANIKNLVTAYELIKSKPGNMTPGADDQTLDGLDLKYLKAIQKKLKTGQYEFPPARRIQIPKPGKTETRPITIASPRHKIVQEAVKLVMEQEFEKMFLESSHGFRPKRGTHTAIRYVDAKFQSAHYIIEADFTKAFDRIPHQKLMSIIKKHVSCDKVLKLLQSSLKAGYFEFGELHQNLAIGTPQGSTLSPLLCNIYLNELDHYMARLKAETDKGDRRKRSKEYESLMNKIKY